MVIFTETRVAFDWEIRISDFAIECFRVDFNQEIQSGFRGFLFLPFDWEIRKRICKTILVNSGLLFANYACACKTAVL